MLSIIKRILSQLKNDKRSLGLLIFAPLLVITLLYFILDDSSYVPKIAVFDINEQLVTGLDENAELTILDELPVDDNYLETNNLDALFYTDTDGLKLLMLEQNSKSTAALKAITDAVANLQKNSPNQIETSYVYETDSENLLDSMSYVILGVISFFFVFILSGMSFVRERFGQTLERMLTTPISRVDVIGGYTIGYGILAALQSVVIILYSAYVLSIHIEGSVGLSILVMILMAFSAVSIGALVSIFANNELQLVQFIPVVVNPQIFFSGLIPIDTIPFGLGNLCYFAPIYYGCTALQKIMIQGKGLAEIWPWLLGSFAYILILFSINVLALKKYRSI